MRSGEAPHHIIGWAVQDWLTAKIRTRTLLTGDLVLRCVYFELLNVLYANGGAVPRDPTALVDLLMVPVDEVERCLPLLERLGYVTVTEGQVRNERVTRTLLELDSVRARRANGGFAGARYGSLGGRPKTTRALKVRSSESPQGDSETPSGIGIGKEQGKEQERNNENPESEVLAYWTERAHVRLRSRKVEQAVERRIAARLKDGFSTDDLRRAVDVACADEFYVQKGYYKQPDVIFRNAERVQSLLARREAAAARPLPL